MFNLNLGIAGKTISTEGMNSSHVANPEVIAKSKNFVSAALDASLAGKAVETASAKPCDRPVKYQ